MFLRLICCLLTFTTCLLQAQEIAITFDDAPTGDGPLYSGSDRTERILGHLKTHRTQAAFFILTGNINELSKPRVLEYSKAEHLLANHSHRHQHIHEMGTRAYIKDVATADSILRPQRGFINFFRFPFLDEGKSGPVRDSIRNALRNLKLKNGYVTIDNYDWYINSLVKEAKNKKQRVNEGRLREIYVNHIYNSVVFYDRIARETLGRSPRHVLLLHENDLAALYLGDLLTHLKKNGWKIISPEYAYGDPISDHVPDVLFNGQGRVAAIAREKGTPARQLVQESEDEEYLQKLMRNSNVFE